MKEKPTNEALMTAVVGMTDVIPFAPKSKTAKEIIARALGQFVETQEQLDWLVDTAIKHMREFSIPELRGLFCTRWKPRDGVDSYATAPGFTAADLEAQYVDSQAKETAAQIEKWKTAKRLAPPDSVEPFVLPPGAGPKLLPPPQKRVPLPPPATDSRKLADVEAEVKASLKPPRSPEENDRLARELADQVARRQKA